MVTAKKSTNLNVEMPKTFKKRVTKFSRSGQAKPNTTLSHIASNRHNNNTNSNSNNNNNNRNRTMGNINVSKTTFNTFMRKTMSKTTTVNNNSNNNKTPKRFMNICTTPANNLKTLQPRRSILMAKMRKRNAKILKSKIALQQKQKHNAHGHVQRGMTNNAAVVNSNKTTSTTLKKKKKTGMHVRRIRHDINNTNTNNNNTQTYAYTNAQRTTGGGSSAGFGSVGGFGRGYGGGGVGVGVGASGSKPLKNVRNCTTKTTTTRATTPAKTRTIKKKPKLRKKHVRTTTTNTHGRLRGGEDKHNKTVEKSPILYIIEDEKMNKRDKKMHTKEAAKRLKYSMLQAKAASIEKRYGSLAAADIRKTNRKLQKGKTTKKLQLKGFLQTKSKAKSSKLHFFYNMGQKQQQQQLQQQQLQLQQQQRKQHLAGKRLTNQKRKPKKKAKLPQKRDAFKCINDIEVPLTAHVPILDITTAMGVDGVGGGGGVGISNAGGGQQYFNQYLQNRDQQLRKLLKQQNKI